MTHRSSTLFMSRCFCITVANVVLAATSTTTTTTTTTATTTKPTTEMPTKTTEDADSKHELTRDKQSGLNLDLPFKGSSPRVPSTSRRDWKVNGWTGLKKKGGKIGGRQEISLPLSPLFSSLMYDFWKPTDTLSGPSNRAEERASLEERFDQLFPSWPATKFGGVPTTFRGGVKENVDDDSNDGRGDNGDDVRMIDLEVPLPFMRSSVYRETDGDDHRDTGRPSKTKFLMHLVNSVLYPGSGSRRFQQHRPLDRRHGIGRLLMVGKHGYDDDDDDENDDDDDDDNDGAIDWNREWKKPHHPRHQPRPYRHHLPHHQLKHHHEHRHNQHHKQQKAGNSPLTHEKEWGQLLKHQHRPEDEKKNQQRLLQHKEQLQRHFGKQEQEKQQTKQRQEERQQTKPQPQQQLQKMQQAQQQQQQQQFEKPPRTQPSDDIMPLRVLLDKTGYTKHGEMQAPLSLTHIPVKAGHDYTSIGGDERQVDGKHQDQHTGVSIDMFPYGIHSNRVLAIETAAKDSQASSLDGSDVTDTGKAESSNTDTVREMKGVDKVGVATEMGNVLHLATSGEMNKHEVNDIGKGNFEVKKTPLSFSSGDGKVREGSGDILGMKFSPSLEGLTSDKKADEEHNEHNDNNDNNDDNRQASPLGYNLVDVKVKNHHHERAKVGFQSGHERTGDDANESLGNAHVAFVDGVLSGRADRNRRDAVANRTHDTVRNKMGDGVGYNPVSPKHNSKGLHHDRNMHNTGELGSIRHEKEKTIGDKRNHNNNNDNHNNNNDDDHKDRVKHIDAETRSHDRRRTENIIPKAGTIQHSGVGSTNKGVGEGRHAMAGKGRKNTKTDGKDNKWFGLLSFDDSPDSRTTQPPASLLSSLTNKTDTARKSLERDEKRIHIHQGALGIAILGLMLFVVVAVSCTVSCATASNQGMRRADSRTAIYSPNNYYDDHNNRRQNFAFLDT